MSNKDSETELSLLQCSGCGKQYVPPKYLCTECGKSDFSEVFSQGKGEVYSFTIIRMPFEEFADEAPYAFAEVKLDGGLVVPGRFTNEGEKAVEIGLKVSFVKWDRGVNWFELT